MADYKYKIDKAALVKFFTMDNPPKESYKAIHLVIMTVLIKHFAKYINIKEELEAECNLKLSEIRKQYDPSFSAYNYAYTACRNQIGNYLNKQREVIVEDILPLSNASVTPAIVSLPAEINKFKKVLTGEQKFTIIDLTPKDAINLACFVEINQHTRDVTPPEFITSNPKAAKILYKILSKI